MSLLANQQPLSTIVPLAMRDALEVLAMRAGVTRGEFVRRVLADAVQASKRPTAAEIRRVRAARKGRAR
ncbi:MAG: hypothetical protein RIS45_51 [Planctomycetota bacterium]